MLQAEFVYRIPGTSGNSRPGAHRSAQRGSGMVFAAHARLFDQPDPRRLDLRASIGNVQREWLVKTSLQRSAVSIAAVLDVSASMCVGTPNSKLQVATDFLQALGYSAHRYGDPVSLLPFDAEFRADLFLPARGGRGVGLSMAAQLGDISGNTAKAGRVDGLAAAVAQLKSTAGLVFLVSDYHWPLHEMPRLLDRLAGRTVVPIVIWDKAETTPPAAAQWMWARDSETGQARHLWLGKRQRARWLDQVATRRQLLATMFREHNMHPFYIENGFDAEALSRYFLERVA